jgi:hypothetical protein
MRSNPALRRRDHAPWVATAIGGSAALAMPPPVERAMQDQLVSRPVKLTTAGGR